MSWFFIDTHRSGFFRAGWLGPKPSVKTYKERADKLLKKIGNSKAWKKRCTGVCVVAGPGSFSAVRLGVLYANLLARLNNVPLVSISVDEASDPQATSYKLPATGEARLRRQAGELQPSPYVAPIYDAEPNITVPRQS